MSFGGKANIPTKAPKTAGLDSNDVSSNEQAVPVPWWQGPDWRPLTWVVPEGYNRKSIEIRQKVGKGKESVTGHKEYVDVAGIAGLGVVHRIRAIESNNEVVWEGAISRPDDPEHPDYWRAKIVTAVGTFYVYWGRATQPIDDILLGPLGAANPALRHPAYRNQVLVVITSYYIGEGGGSVPNTRLLLDRAPVPAIGNFPILNSPQGESMIAGILELATNPIFGAGLSETRFAVGEWEALSAQVVSGVGCHAPSLDRAKPFRDVVSDFQLYYDGWCRLENGRLQPGFFPHSGDIPSGLTELSVHDFVERPKIRAGTTSKTVNDVVVVYRDRNDLLKKKPVSESASDNVEARRAHETSSVDMLGIIDPDQAAVFAAEAAATGAEGEWEGEIKVRAPRAVWPDGTRLQAGANFNLDLIGPEVDQISRITKRTDPYDGPPLLEIVAERGVYPTPYVRPSDLRPATARVVPDIIAHARVLELTTELAGTPLGLPIAVLAMRPPTKVAGATLPGASVIGLNVWYSAAGASYDTLGNTSGWSVRGTLRAPVANAGADVTVQLALDAANLDRGRLGAQGSDSQANDTLLLVIGDEVLSVGAVTIAGLNYDFACKRARQGSRAAAHAMGVEAWLIYRDELRGFAHKGFIEDQDRSFKLQPYTSTATIELSEIDPLVYHFRDRADERPVVVINAFGAGLRVGVTYTASGSISDVNGDLTTYQVNAARLTALGGAIDAQFSLQAGEVRPADRALFTWKAPFVFPQSGTWRIVVRAYDERVGFTEVQTAELAVAEGTGDFGPDDGVVPDAIALGSVTITSGIEQLILRWTNPTNTPLAFIRIYQSATGVRPASPLWILPAPQDFLFVPNVAEGATLNFWFEVQAKNTRLSAITGPKAGTVLVWPRISDIEARLTGKITRAADAPADPHVGDLWFDGTNGYRPKVWNGIAWEEAKDAAITQLEAMVNDPDTGLAATYAEVFSGAVTWANADGALAALITAVTARVDDAEASVATEATARADADGSLAAEYVLQVVTNTGGERRIAGFRVTNQGGGGGATEFVIQADKIAMVNAVGENQRAPFALVGGIVYLDTALIREATISSGMIESLVADKITAGELHAMVLTAAKTATNSVYFNTETPDSTFPSFVVRRGYNGAAHSINGVEYIPMVAVYGWASGTGYATDRFGRSDIVVAVNVKGGFTITPSGFGFSHADIRGVFRINGGTWMPATEQARAIPDNGGATVGDAVEISGLSGSDTVEFGAEVSTPAPQGFGHAVLSIWFGNQ